tara:strand:+ start:17769 stop:18752 length:984 start_codon:yes stop_codon:yes gene_type:complete
MIICRTPFRISFFGGGTDFPQWYVKEGGGVISTTIDKYCYINARYLPEFFKFNYRIRYFKTEQTKTIKQIKHPSFREILKYLDFYKQNIEIVHNADIPALSGMGASSSSSVCLLHALNALKNTFITKKKLSLDALKIEQEILKETVGSQDQIAAAFGGFNYIKFNKNNTFEVNPIFKSQNISKIEDSITLMFTGLQRKANIIERNKIKNLKSNSLYLNEMNSITQTALDMVNGNFKIKEFGKLLSDQWSIKKKLSHKTTNNFIDRLYLDGMKCGAYGAKLLGAGNGGFIMFISNKDVKQKLLKKFKKFLFVPIKFDKIGSQIVYFSK